MRGRLCLALASVLCAGATPLAVARTAAADPTLPSVTVGDVSVWEGNGGLLVVKVPVDLSVTPTSAVKLSYSITADGASAGDFVARTGKLSFLAGSAPSRAIAVKILGDTTEEPDEHVLVHITAATGAQVEKGDGGVTILNDDSGVSAGVEVGIGNVSVVEADGGRHVASLPVTLSVPAPTTIKVAYSVDCGTADPGVDYTTKSKGTITFLLHQQTKYINFQIGANTSPDAFIKQVVDRISVLVGPAVVRQSQGQTTIVDNDTEAPPSSSPVPVGVIQRVNVSSSGAEAEPPAANVCDQAGPNSPPQGIWGSAISRNGRYVAFASAAANLVDGDTNGIMDVFVRDLQTQTTERVSLKPNGAEFTSSNLWAGGSSRPAISADGRYVTFYPGNDDIYIRDRVTGTTRAVSSHSPGGSGESSISDDGRFVAYSSYASQVAGVAVLSPAQDAVFVWDGISGTTSLVAVRSGADHSLGKPVISGNGRYVAFTDESTNLVAGDTNGCGDTFVRDLQTGQTEQVSVTNSGAQQVTDWPTLCSVNGPMISDDGRFVGFSSSAWNLYPGATGSSDLGSGAPSMHPYLRDRTLGTTELVDTTSAPNQQASFSALSDNGRYVIFGCFCGDPVPITPTVNDYVAMWYDRQTGTLRQVGVQADGTPPIDEDTGGFTFTGAFGGVSGDGMTVAFESFATNLVPDDSNSTQDAFVQQMG